MLIKILHKTVITIEVLSEYPIPAGMAHSDIINEAINGDFSMRVLSETTSKLSGDEARNAILAQGSDPEFFGFKPPRRAAAKVASA